MNARFGIVLVAVMMVQASWGVAAAQSADTSAKAEAVLERTKANRGTYAMYNWYRITHEGQPAREEWAAEYNTGSLHRVEVPAIRVVADCDGLTASLIDPKNGEILDYPAASETACGISTMAPILSMEWLGQVDTRFGKADRIRVTDAEEVRTYDVSQDGVILWSRFEMNRPDRHVDLETFGYDLRRELPAAGMFDRASLGKVFTPEAYQHADGYPR